MQAVSYSEKNIESDDIAIYKGLLGGWQKSNWKPNLIQSVGVANSYDFFFVNLL